MNEAVGLLQPLIVTVESGDSRIATVLYPYSKNLAIFSLVDGIDGDLDTDH